MCSGRFQSSLFNHFSYQSLLDIIENSTKVDYGVYPIPQGLYILSIFSAWKVLQTLLPSPLSFIQLTLNLPLGLNVLVLFCCNKFTYEGQLKQQIFLTVLEAGKWGKIKVLVYQVSGEILLPGVQMAVFSL